jgi:CRP-like cAMP-binding protein
VPQNPRGMSFAADYAADPLELRSDPRIAISAPARLYTSEFSGALPAVVRDLSVKGACIATPSPFAFKSLDRIEVDLPSGRLCLRAQGCWQRDQEADDVILTGVSFEDEDGPERDQLWNAVLQGGHDIARFVLESCDLPELTLEDALGLAQVTRHRQIAVGRAIYRAHDDARTEQLDEGDDAFFLILRGEVSLSVRIRGVRDQETARLGRGSAFGGLPLVSGTAQAESAVAASDCEMLEIDAGSFRYLRTARPWLGQRLGQAILRTNAQRLTRLLSEVASGRLAG